MGTPESGGPARNGSTIDVIDLQDHKLAGTIDLGKGLGRTAPNLDRRLLYVTAETCQPR